MSLSYAAGLAARGTIHLPLAVARNGTMEWTFEIPDYDASTATSLAFHIRDYPDSPGAPAAQLTPPTVTISSMTWDAWLTSRPGGVLPHGAVGTDMIVVSYISADFTLIDAESLAANAVQRGANTRFYYDVQIKFADHVDIPFAGEFDVSGGVSGVNL